MAKGEDKHSEMADARRTDGINVIFDHNSPASSRSRSTSSPDSSRSGLYRGRDGHRGRHRSPSSSSSTSSSSSSSSSSRSRSRSYPRCHRYSPRCRCGNYNKYGRGRHHHSPSRRYRAHSRSYSRSSSQEKYFNRRRSRSRSRSSGSCSRYSRGVSRYRSRFPRTPARTYRYRSRSRSSGRSVTLSVDDKRELLTAAKANAMKILGVEKLELPESVKSILPEQSESRVRQDAEKTQSQCNEVEPDDMSSPKMSPKVKIVFSTNNSVAKPTVIASSSAKVTPRVDSYESRKPYGHWIPIKPVQTSNAR